MNFTTKNLIKEKCALCLMALILIGLTASCSNDESEEEKIGNYIVTNPVESVGVTYVELSGEFYSNKMPKAYNSSGRYMQPGIEISLTESFTPGMTLHSGASGIENNRMTMTVYGLSPNTKYYYRSFVDIDDLTYYGEKKSFTTLGLSLACSVDDAIDVSFRSALVPVNFNNVAASLSPEDLSVYYGVAYTTDKSLFSEINPNVSFDTNGAGIILCHTPYSSNGQVVSLDNLQPNTTYYYCAFTCTDGKTDCLFGPVKSFTTENRDGLLVIDAIDAKFILAEVAGTTKLPSSMTGVTYRLVYEMLNEPLPWPTEVEMNVDGDKLTAVVRNLWPNRKYQCWITAIKDGEIYAESEKKELKTDNPSDYIEMDDATDITSTSATISCRLTAEGYEDEEWCNIYYGKDKYNQINETMATKNGDRYTVTLTGLQPNTTYYYRGQALFLLEIGRADWYYSDIKSFKTLP